MKKSKLVRLSLELTEEVDKRKPAWMSYDQYFADLLVPIGDESHVERRLARYAEYNLMDVATGDSVTIMLDDAAQLINLKKHLVYLKGKYGLAFSRELRAQNSKLAVELHRIS